MNNFGSNLKPIPYFLRLECRKAFYTKIATTYTYGSSDLLPELLF